MARRIGRQTVTIVARTADSDGDWTDGARTVVTGCLLQPLSGSEGEPPGRTAASLSFTVYGPQGLSGARPGDQLETSGEIVGDATGPVQRLSVDGRPRVWTTTRGTFDHVELTAVLVTG